MRMVHAAADINSSEEMTDKLRLWQRYALVCSSSAKLQPHYGGATSTIANGISAPDNSLVSSSNDSQSSLSRERLQDPYVCLHQKPIFHKFYDLDQLPGSQSLVSQN